MKLQLILSPLVVAAVAALAACSEGNSAPATTATTSAPAASEVAAAPDTEGLSRLPDQLTAEEIQARREAWVTGGATPSGERVAAAPAAKRE